MATTTFSGPVVSENGFTGNITGNITGDVQGAALTTEKGSGTAGAAAYSTEITKVGKTIYTHIYIDIAGLVVSTTDNDIIGDSAAANAHIGQITVAESGQIFAGSMSCLEAPTTGVTDINLAASSASTGAESAAVTALADPVALVTAGGAWTLGETQSLTAWPTATSDYLYLSAGAAGTPGTYDAGQFLIELVGYEA